jgi:hypothetical protein
MYRTAALGTMIAMAAWVLLAPRRSASPSTDVRRQPDPRDEAELAYWSAFWNGNGRRTASPATGRSLRAARDAVDGRLREAINRMERAA